jgi:hypothetical protein
MRSLICAASIAITIATPWALAKEYRITPQYSGGRKVIFETPPGWVQGAVSPDGNEIIFRQPDVSWLPELSIIVRHLYGEHSSESKHYIKNFVIWLDAAQKTTGQNDSPKPELTEVESSNGSTSHNAAIWCVRCAAYHDYFITELIDGDIQVEIFLEAPDADELVDKVNALKTLVSSVRILD